MPNASSVEICATVDLGSLADGERRVAPTADEVSGQTPARKARVDFIV